MLHDRDTALVTVGLWAVVGGDGRDGVDEVGNGRGCSVMAGVMAGVVNKESVCACLVAAP